MQVALSKGRIEGWPFYWPLKDGMPAVQWPDFDFDAAFLLVCKSVLAEPFHRFDRDKCLTMKINQRTYNARCWSWDE